MVVMLHCLPARIEGRLNHHDKNNHTIGHIVDDLVSHKTHFRSVVWPSLSEI